MTIYANNYGLHSRIWKNTSVITTLSRSACTQSSQAKGNMAQCHLFTQNHSILGHCNWFSSSQHWEPGNNMLLHQDFFPKQIAQGYLQVEEIGNLSPIFPTARKEVKYKTRRCGKYKRPSKEECETKEVSIWCVAACGVEMVGHYTTVSIFTIPTFPW